MNTASIERWDELDELTREMLDEQYLRELSSWYEPRLTDDGVRAYLDYRHERPGVAITTFEEGQIRKLLQRYRDPAPLPGPADREEHSDPLERFGARRLHLTNTQTFGAILFVVWLLAITFLLIVVLTR